MTALIFVPLLAGAAGVTCIVAIFASHYFMTILESTAYGQRHVGWTSEETFHDWLPKPFQLAWLAAPWIFPAVLLSAGLAIAKSPVVAGVATVAAIALLFPLGALSSLVAGSAWVPFHPRAIPLLLKRPVVLFVFSGIAVACCIVGIGGGLLAVYSDKFGFYGLIPGCLLASLAWFVYAVAVGRLLYAVSYSETRDVEPRTSRRPVTSVEKPPKSKRAKPKRSARKPVIDGYQLQAEEPTPQPPRDAEPPIPHWERPKPAWDDGDDSPYAAHQPEVAMAKTVKDAKLFEPKESEMKLIARDDVPPPPDQPWNAEALAPLGQSETMRSLVILAILLGFYAGLVRTLIDLNPMK